MRFISIAACAFISMSALASVNVEKIQQQIHEQGHSWKAGHTWVSDLPEDQVRRMMGNREVVHDTLDYSDAYSKSATYETVDWRNMDGINWLSPVMNQGNCGSCVAFATVGTLEASVSIANKTPWLNPQFSPQQLFACGGAKCEMGWFPESGASFVKNKGIVDNACAPYTMGSDGKDVACKQFCNDQSNRTYKAADSFKASGMFSTSVQKVKDALKKGPLMTSMTVYEDFLTYTGGIYKSVSRKSVGGHAVSIVGYNDAEKYWIVRNSWGEDWGEKGFIRVSWDDKSGVGSSTIGFTITPQTAAVSVVKPAENDYVSGDLMVATQSSRSDEFDIKLMKDGKEISTTRSGSSINTAGLEDGKYEMVAVSTMDAKVKSFTRGFTVVNSVPAMSVSYTPADDADYSAPVTARHEFNITVNSTPVMPRTIDIVLTDMSGKMVTKRTTDVVLASMKLGFRFNSLPDGEYMFFLRLGMPVGGKTVNIDSDKLHVTVKN